MRLRFSLRTLFITTTIVAGLCVWFVLPTLSARRFLAAVANEDYKSADSFFRNPDDRVFEQWANDRWSFRSSSKLPWPTIGQLLRGQRQVCVEISYFENDQFFSCELRAVATAFGLKKQEISPEQRNGIYDGRGDD